MIYTMLLFRIEAGDSLYIIPRPRGYSIMENLRADCGGLRRKEEGLGGRRKGYVYMPVDQVDIPHPTHKAGRKEGQKRRETIAGGGELNT